MSWENGNPPFGLNDCKLAAYTDTNTYSAAVDVFSVQMVNFNMRTVQAELTGDDQITAIAARAIAGQIELRFGGVSLAALEVMLGLTATSSVASPSNVKNLRIGGGTSLPYFGLIAKSLAAEGGGQLELWIPKAKIMSDVQLVQLEYGVFSTNTVTLMCVPDETYGLASLIEVETARAITIPPANVPTIA